MLERTRSTLFKSSTGTESEIFMFKWCLYWLRWELLHAV